MVLDTLPIKYKGYNMNKTELNKALVAGLIDLGASDEAVSFVDRLTKPKLGGGSSDVNEYTVFGEDGVPTHVFCTYHKKWEPVEDAEGEALFKANEKSKNGFLRTCNEGEASWKEQAKVFKATKDAVISDLLEGEIDNDSAKELIAAAETDRAVHSDREDELGTDDKPEGFDAPVEA